MGPTPTPGPAENWMQAVPATPSNVHDQRQSVCSRGWQPARLEGAPSGGREAGGRSGLQAGRSVSHQSWVFTGAHMAGSLLTAPTETLQSLGDDTGHYLLQRFHDVPLLLQLFPQLSRFSSAAGICLLETFYFLFLD